MIKEELIRDDLRTKLSNVRGFRGIGLVYKGDTKTYRIIVKIEKRNLKTIHTLIPSNFEGLPVDIISVSKSRFLGII
jgi:hypothetical protein